MSLSRISIVAMLMTSVLTVNVSTTNAFSDVFWQITDVHLDEAYSRTGDPNDMCHGVGVVDDNGYYGNRVCDTNYQLMLTSFKAMSLLESNPDFILWTGDNAPHIEYPNETWSDVYSSCNVIARSIRNYFPTSVILPVLGNHDTVPSGQFPADDPAFYQAYLDVANWSSLLPPEQQMTFLRGGFYSYQVRTGLKVVILNTALYLQENQNVSATDSDPSGQFTWLELEFAESRSINEKVLVSSHVCAGYYANGGTQLHLKAPFNDRLIDVITDNSDVILSLVFGHEHVDTFRLFADRNGTFKTQAFLGGPVNPWIPDFMLTTNAVNPGVRLYHYDLSQAAPAPMISDYEQYYLDYREANNNVTTNHTCQDAAHLIHSSSSAVAVCTCIPDNAVSGPTSGQACATLRLLYRPTEAYGVPDLSTASVVAMYEAVLESDDTFQLYRNYSCLDYVIAPCDDTCKNNFLCSIANITADQMTACLNLTTVTTVAPTATDHQVETGGEDGQGFLGQLFGRVLNWGKLMFSSLVMFGGLKKYL